jgi:hypothetical protein
MPAENSFDQILDAIQRCAAPIWTNDSLSAPPASVVDSGTCGFIDTGERRLLLTAHHVIEGFRIRKAEQSEAVLAVNLGPGCTVTLDRLDIVDQDAELDLAILSFPDLHAWSGEHDKRYFPIRTWPIDAPRRGDLIALIGFPGVRRVAAENYGSFEPVGLGFSVSSASDHNIVLADESETFRTINRDRSIGSAIRLGGFSGSPAFLISPAGPQLVGVFRAGPNDEESASHPLVFLSPTRYLRPDGTIDRLSMPPVPPRLSDG